MDNAAHPKTWRACFMALCALSVALTFADVLLNVVASGSTGILTTPTHAPFLERVVAAPPRSLVRAGDIIDFRTLSPGDRWRWLHGQFGFFQGESVALTVTRGGRSLRVAVVAAPPLHLGSPLASLASWPYWLGTLGGLWMNVFAALIAWRRPASREARVLAWLLLLIPIGAVFADWSVGPPAITALLFAAGGALYAVGGALLATYAMLFKPVSRVRTLLAWSTYGLFALYVIAAYAWILATWTLAIDPNGGLLSGTMNLLIGLLPFVFPVLCGAFAIAETRGAERARLSWAMASLGLFYLLLGVDNLLSDDIVGNALGNIGFFIAPLGLTYGLLNRKLLDVGFALNRAAIFTGVSVVVVAVFVLVEWAFGEWLQGASHAANVAVSGGLALLLGFSVRFVHGRVEHVVDNVFFRKRHEDEAALRAFAHEAGYINNAETLVTRTISVIERHADATSVEIAADDGDGRYGDVSEDDPAIVALRAWNKPLDLHGIETALRGELALPMMARGRLVGALVVGPKRSGEIYAPDETDAILQVAQSVGTSLAILDRKPGIAGDALVEIRALGRRISENREEIRALSQRLDGHVM